MASSVLTPRQRKLKAKPAPMMIRVMLVDDYAYFRQYVRKMMIGAPGMEVIAEAADGFTAVQLAEQFRPDVILMDIDIPFLNGLDAAKEILNTSPATRIIFLTAHVSLDLMERALKTGARGYLIKTHVSTELVPAIQEVFLGNTYISKHLGDI